MAKLLCLRGELVVVGKSPDGDSIRFRPDSPDLVAQLDHGDRARPSSDGTFQLRLDGIDAPETHYGTLAQPLGEPARDDLLAWCGFTDVHWASGLVTAATPERIPAAVLGSLVDVNGRPIVLLLRDRLPADGAHVQVTTALLDATANVALLRSGAAYATLYASTAETVRAKLRELAAAARSAHLGVWPRDRSAGFVLRSQTSIGPRGSLILPKLFRRCSDYLRSRTSGETLPQWLVRMGDNEDDQVLVARAATPVRLSTLVTQAGERVALEADPLDLVFKDK
jgi:endonuclease YncB( thermonuclease family)